MAQVCAPRTLTVKGEALAIVDALIMVDEVLEVVVGILDAPNLADVVDKVSDQREH